MGSGAIIARLGKGISLSEAPIGTFSPTPLQSAIIKFARTAGLGNGAVRNYGAIAVTKIRPAPVDFDYYGLTLRLYPTLYPSARHMLFTPVWSEYHERAFILRHLPKNGNFVDVGANAGLFLFAIAALRRDCKVLAFEPMDDYASILNFNIRANKLDNVIVEPVALSDADGEVMIDRATKSILSGRGVTTVKSARLQSVLAKHGLGRIDVLKIDVEGVEDRVLMPFFRATQPSVWPRAVVMEICFREHWQEDCLAYMLANGYSQVFRHGLNVGLVRPSG